MKSKTPGRPNVLERRQRLTNVLPSFSDERKRFMGRVLGKNIQLHSANRRDVDALEKELQKVLPQELYTRFWAFDDSLKGSRAVKDALARYLASEPGTDLVPACAPAPAPVSRPTASKLDHQASFSDTDTVAAMLPPPSPAFVSRRPKRAAATKARSAFQLAAAGDETEDDNESEAEAYNSDDAAEEEEDDGSVVAGPMNMNMAATWHLPPPLAPAPAPPVAPAAPVAPILPVVLGKRDRADTGVEDLEDVIPLFPFGFSDSMAAPPPPSPLAALLQDDTNGQLDDDTAWLDSLLELDAPLAEPVDMAPLVPIESPRTTKRGRRSTLELCSCTSCPGCAAAPAAAPLTIDLALADLTPLHQIMCSVNMTRPGAVYQFRAVFANSSTSFPIPVHQHNKSLADLTAEGMTSLVLCRPTM